MTAPINTYTAPFYFKVGVKEAQIRATAQQPGKANNAVRHYLSPGLSYLTVTTDVPGPILLRVVCKATDGSTATVIQLLSIEAGTGIRQGFVTVPTWSPDDFVYFYMLPSPTISDANARISLAVTTIGPLQP